ncbi:hypothetical protein GCK32_001848 [Trichostrongylus colubriformis]|uniref:Uncharacterized protein n=1 Tax=Trichostrongylus colubriformis TaxID=6319 RepID=A0AAN8G4N7_TRICO
MSRTTSTFTPEALVNLDQIHTRNSYDYMKYNDDRGKAPTDIKIAGGADADYRMDALARLIYGNNLD